MLIAFFKSHEDKNCKCEVVKFVDRIWIDKSGRLICIRTMIVHVDPSSEPMHELRMLTPFRQIPELDEISYTCLDDGYLFNNPIFSTGGYHIKSLDIDKTYGSVTYDNFDVDVYTTNTIISFESPLSPEYRVICVKFKNEIIPDHFA